MEKNELYSHPDDQIFDQDDPVTQTEVSNDSGDNGLPVFNTTPGSDPIALPMGEDVDPEESIYGVNPDKPIHARQILNPDS